MCEPWSATALGPSYIYSVDNALDELVRAKKELRALREAVHEFYVSAYWKPDRYVENERTLWEKLRDAAGIAEGTKGAMMVQGEVDE